MLLNNKKLKKQNEMVQVVVRCRPMNEKEIEKNCTKVVKVEPSNNTVEIYDSRQENLDYGKVFTYDAVFDGISSQCEIYDEMVRPLIDAVLSGYNCTVFAYGQSGSGKTYTMEGESTDSTKGVIPRTFQNIFDHISKSSNIQYLIRASYMEIYQDEIRDLLVRKVGKKYELRESKHSGVYVKDLSSFVCKNEKEMNTLIETGRRNRTTASTNMNERSSRSHAIVTITVEMKDLTGPLEGRVCVGKLNLVDLAGSERQNKTNAEGERLKEANKINLSLSALGNVISALSEGKNNYIPYRDSKLTRILKDSLGGNSKTLMIANIGPASYNYEESLNTLRYATRAKNIRNDPQVNEDPVDTLIKRYQDEIKRLKCLLTEQTTVKKSYKIEILGHQKSWSSKKLSKPDSGNDSLSESESIQIPVVNSNNKTNGPPFEDIQEIKKQIVLMESRLLMGNKNIYTAEQKKALEEHTHKLNIIKQREKQTLESLEKVQEIAEERKEVYHTLQQEVEIKSKRLAKFYFKLKEVQQEINDARDEFNADRRELEITQQEILKEIKLKLMIMENFIPKEHRRQIFPRMYYNEDMDCWQLNPNFELCQLHLKPKSIKYMKQPLTLYSTLTKGKTNVLRCDQTEEDRKRNLRFKGENILDLDLIQSPCLIKDYKPPKLPPMLNRIFQTALQLEEDIDIDASMSSSNVYSNNNSSKRSFESILNKHCETNPRKTQSAVNMQVYPKARGLVPK